MNLDLMDKNFEIDIIPTSQSNNKIIETIKEFESMTKYIPLSLKDMEVYHIIHFDEEFIYLLSVSKVMNFLEDSKKELIKMLDGEKEKNNVYPRPLKIEVDKIEKSMVERIKSGNIKTLLVLTNKNILFMDENARSVIVGKCNATGKAFYTQDIFADINLYNSLQRSATELLPVAVIRKQGNVNLLISLLSEKRKPLKLSGLQELNDSSLIVSRFKLNNYQAMIEFDIKGYLNRKFIPSIRISWSDAGRGLLKKSLCVRPKGSKKSCIIKEINEENIQNVINDFLKIENNITKKSVISPYTQISASLKPIGKKRLERLIKPYLKGKFTEEEYFEKILAIPDFLGPINDVTDIAVEQILGQKFLTGAETY